MSVGSMTDSIAVTAAQHRFLGAMVRLSLPGGMSALLTREEAATIARALSAVRDGRSRERTIYLSPIASDHAVTATVWFDGVTLSVGPAEHPLDWGGVDDVAAALLGDGPKAQTKSP
ncbi:hypothetical protein M2352_001638 [Azospirillum fermentarium]|uniref:hypothetical protein n=1 Tax=Azospirillum fermentarium TaxID=1233114 RepID=UPI0022277599|nr:hypothetical protein [Azospirillum fermentarium]MCW2246047.1 hypothetical protein [Azospirillum fermentarium]